MLDVRQGKDVSTLEGKIERAGVWQLRPGEASAQRRHRS